MYASAMRTNEVTRLLLIDKLHAKVESEPMAKVVSCRQLPNDLASRDLHERKVPAPSTIALMINERRENVISTGCDRQPWEQMAMQVQ